MAIVLITGGSGLVGKRLTTALLAARHSVRWLSRHADPHATVPAFRWDIHRGDVDERALEGVEHIVHLSGAGIADKRWTPARMKELYASRGGAARLLLRKVLAAKARPSSFISASGIGYYGAVTSEHVLEETDPAGSDTIARLTKDWEQAADEWASHARVVKLRTSTVLAREGGALPRLSAPARWGLATGFGTGRQWMTWVHIDDLVNAYVRAITDEHMRGAYNVAAGDQSTNRAFTRALAKALHRPYVLPNVPGFALRIALGELSDVLLEGSRASNARLVSTGFRFEHGILDEALRDTLV